MSLINEVKSWFVDKFKTEDRQSLWVKLAGINFADALGIFNPLALPLKVFTRIIEINEVDATTDFPEGIYFINASFVQFQIKTNAQSPMDLEIVENNILLLDSNTALKLNVSGGAEVFSINDVFLELS